MAEIHGLYMGVTNYLLSGTPENWHFEDKNEEINEEIWGLTNHGY